MTTLKNPIIKREVIDYEIYWAKEEGIRSPPPSAPIPLGVNDKRFPVFDSELLEIKKTSSESHKKIDKILKKLSLDSRRHGVGSSGGPIARKLKVPGPLNGHHAISINDTLMNAQSFSFSGLSKYKLCYFRPLNHPDWNNRFVFGGTLSPPIVPRTSSRITKRVNKFRHEIGNFRKSHILSASTPSLSYIEHFPLPDNSMESTEPNSSSSSISATTHPLIEISRSVWTEMADELRLSCESMLYSDFVELLTMPKPPDLVVSIVGYICTLLGISATWLSARATILKDFGSLKSLQEVCIKFNMIDVVHRMHDS